MKYLKTFETSLNDIDPAMGTSDGNTSYDSILPYHEWDKKLANIYRRIEDSDTFKKSKSNPKKRKNRKKKRKEKKKVKN